MKLDRKTWLLIGGSVALLLLALGLTMAYISVTYRAPVGAEQPKITDWMQAWGSVLGVFAGLIAGGAAALLLMFERRQASLARAEADAARAEADLAAVRAVLVADPRLSIANGAITGARVEVGNYGGRAIRRIVIVIQLLPQSPELVGGPLNYLAPGGVHEFDFRLRPYAALPGWEDGPAYDHPNRRAVEAARLAAKVTIYFYDAAGQGWRLTNDGQPEKWHQPFPSRYKEGE
ncbi:hypothetical protein [Micromonospora saelicesensis]|uniref:hypothetical protein n=1 Tax=Micromonospora saelicesensis TaxID=285676 RepID=UPI000DC21D3E|nr:hypothetical protein [Micromonospora saelicesensis]RAO61191.1 hypothetical protein PSN01_01826 [Micromonospora saelicesensis]